MQPPCSNLGTLLPLPVIIGEVSLIPNQTQHCSAKLSSGFPSHSELIQSPFHGLRGVLKYTYHYLSDLISSHPPLAHTAPACWSSCCPFSHEACFYRRAFVLAVFFVLHTLPSVSTWFTSSLPSWICSNYQRNLL